MLTPHFVQWLLGSLLVISSFGVLIAPKPVHACLAFLVTLLSLAALYLQLSAEFVAVMQVLVYAGAILVIFMFVIVLFQDAHQQLELHPPQSRLWFLYVAGSVFLITLVFLGKQFVGMGPSDAPLPKDYGQAHSLGHQLYVEYFFPFEAVILIFLVAVVGALYIGKKEKEKNG